MNKNPKCKKNMISYHSRKTQPPLPYTSLLVFAVSPWEWISGRHRLIILFSSFLSQVPTKYLLLQHSRCADSLTSCHLSVTVMNNANTSYTPDVLLSTPACPGACVYMKIPQYNLASRTSICGHSLHNKCISWNIYVLLSTFSVFGVHPVVLRSLVNE